MTPNSTAGYSGKSLAAKLGLKPAMRVATLHAPKELKQWLAPLPEGVTFVGPRATNAGCALLFATRRTELVRDVRDTLPRLGDGAMLWICWPKKSSGVETDVTEGLLRDIVLPTGWVDVKVCAVSETWSGLKFLRRRAP